MLYGASGTALFSPLPILGEAGKLSDVRLDGHLLVKSRGGQTYHVRVAQRPRRSFVAQARGMRAWYSDRYASDVDIAG